MVSPDGLRSSYDQSLCGPFTGRTPKRLFVQRRNVWQLPSRLTEETLLFVARKLHYAKSRVDVAIRQVAAKQHGHHVQQCHPACLRPAERKSPAKAP